MKSLLKIVSIFTILILFFYSSEGSLMTYEVEKFYKERRIYGGESQSQIVKDFIGLNQDKQFVSLNELKDIYNQFRKNWIQKMIEKVLKDLNINDEAADEARKNPTQFYVSYETYKLLSYR